MTTLCSDVISLLRGKTLATAESLTGGGIGAQITAVSGSSAVYKGGIISYTNAVKETILGVPGEVLEHCGAVSAETARHMAEGARRLLMADAAVSVTGLAGPGGDDFGNPVGTVCIGYADKRQRLAKHYRFYGDRDEIREQAVRAALELVLEVNQ